jgi:hypothetical protein
MFFRRRVGRPGGRPVESPPASALSAAAGPARGAPGAVWLGFADATGVTLAPDDPAARALRAVADALLRGR